jgi:hypothetical protein
VGPMELTIRAVTRQGGTWCFITLRPFVPTSAFVVVKPSGQVVEAKDMDKVGVCSSNLMGKLLSPRVMALEEGVAVEYVIAPKDTEPVLTLLRVKKSDETVTLDFERVELSIETAFVLDAEGLVRDCSSYFTSKITGYTRDQLLGRSINIVVPGLFSVVPIGVSFSCEGVHKNGHTLYLVVTVTRGGGEGNYCCQMRRHSVACPQEVPRVLERLELENVRIGALLGSGAFSSVRLGQMDDRVSAIKFIAKRHSKAALREAEILKMLAHHAVPKFHFVMQSETHVAVGIELCPGIELGNYVRSRRRALSEQECKHYFRQLCSAVSYIHGVGIVHRDIKVENVLLQPCGLGNHWMANHVKLIDFGLSMHLEPGLLWDSRVRRSRSFGAEAISWTRD